ncbi:hypothetical protein NPIL_249501 [Nephila pilipes]|uniref:Uncharacterized protein n=1 Tax=Nephila pilipes TaxID=299642 RepID=A0A8X6T1H8_NEPPI|nr:hypothetical protein NPIL_249501 [Nephila pilipes]
MLNKSLVFHWLLENGVKNQVLEEIWLDIDRSRRRWKKSVLLAGSFERRMSLMATTKRNHFVGEVSGWREDSAELRS